MGSLSTLERKIGTIAYKKNEPKTLEGGLPRGYDYAKLALRLDLNITIVTAAATAYTEAQWKLIKRIEIVGDGKDTIKSFDGPAIARMAHILNGNLPNYSAVPTGVGAGQTMNAALTLFFQIGRFLNSEALLLVSRRYRTLDMRVTWGSESDMYSANAANVTINEGSGSQLTIHSLEDVTNKNIPAFLHKNYSIEKEVTASSTEFKIPITGANFYHGFLIYADVDGNPSDAVIASLELRNGSDVMRKWDWKPLQDDNKSTYDIEAIPSGWAFINCAPDGMVTQLLNSRGMDDLAYVFNATKSGTTTKIRVYPIEFVPAA